jgi:hypothetical protein
MNTTHENPQPPSSAADGSGTWLTTREGRWKHYVLPMSDGEPGVRGYPRNRYGLALETFCQLARYSGHFRFDKILCWLDARGDMKAINFVGAEVIAYIIACNVCFAADSVSDYRIVDGHLYNVGRSILWQDIPPKDAYGSPGLGYVAYTGKVEQVKSNEILVNITVETGNGPAYKNSWHERLVVISNHPKASSFVTGDVFPRDRFLPIQNRTLHNSSGHTITVKAYDYGLPNTTENRKTLTNSPTVK